jgi:hypothetical protein
MVLGLVALIASNSFRPHSSWFFGLYLIAFVTGLILNAIAWKEEKREQGSS